MFRGRKKFLAKSKQNYACFVLKFGIIIKSFYTFTNTVIYVCKQILSFCIN